MEVANASGVGGAAGKLTTDLKTAGFTTATATDATGEKLDTSVVYYVATDPVAQQVARHRRPLDGCRRAGGDAGPDPDQPAASWPTARVCW